MDWGGGKGEGALLDSLEAAEKRNGEKRSSHVQAFFLESCGFSIFFLFLNFFFAVQEILIVVGPGGLCNVSREQPVH